MSVAQRAKIYCLCDPDTGAGRYVGRTTRDPDQRVRDHFADPISKAMAAWLALLTSQGKVPTLRVLEETTKDASADAERKWIRDLKASGASLLNRGSGVLPNRSALPIMVRPRSSEQRAALAAAAKAAKVSLSYYLLESALMVADHEGFHAPAPVGWAPKLKLSPE